MASEKKSEENNRFTEISVSITSLHFHPKNPRREPQGDEDAIRASLCEDEGVISLAKHLSRHGLNPLDRIATIKHPKLNGHFIVVEGNRRLCALQLLRDPERAPTAASRKIFSSLKDSEAQIPDKIPTILFEKEESARVWMSVKHEGEQGGIGTVNWNATQKARFNEQGETDTLRPQNPNRQALALLDFAERKKLITSDQRKNIKITTITRYLSNPIVRSALALLNSEDLTTNANPDEFERVVQRFLLDAIPPENPNETAPVNSRAKKQDRVDYAEKLRQDGFSPRERDQAPKNLAEERNKKNSETSSTPRANSKKNPDSRKNVIPSQFRETSGDVVLSRLVKEGKLIEVNEFVFSSNYLVRAILERIIHLYAKKNGIGISRELESLITACAKHAGDSTPPAPRAVIQIMNKTASNKHASHAPDTLGAGVHGGIIPTAADIKRSWDTLQPIFEWLLSKIA